MQEVSYYDREGTFQKARDYFAGATADEVQAKMRTRLQELEGEGQVVSVKREKIGRNAPCPCGSGRKFKKCCIDQVR